MSDDVLGIERTYKYRRSGQPLVLFWKDLRYRWLGTVEGWKEMESLRGKEYSMAFRRALILGLLERDNS